MDTIEPVMSFQERTNDDRVLESLGYKPELLRKFSPLQIFGVSFSIMSLVPSIASVLSTGIAAGGAGMTWGWFIPCIFIMSIGIALSEFGSALPTSGGLYVWSYKFAPAPIKRISAFFVGYTNTLGLIASVGSINYGFATQLLSCPALTNPSFSPSNAQTFGVFAAATISQALFGLVPTEWMSHTQTLTIVLNSVAIGLILIALPVGLLNKGGKLNSASFVFGDTTNLTDWPYGWSWLLSWLSAIWVISSHDSCIHMAEEAANATVAVPFGIIMSVGLCWVLGFAIMAIIAAVVSPNLSTYYNSSLGNTLAQVIVDCLDEKWAVGIMGLLSAIQWFMGLSCLLATSRQTWAFSRDDGLPLSWWVKKVSKSGIPLNAVIYETVITLLIGLLILVNETAANAIFSLAICSIQLAWMTPILYRAIWFRKDDFRPGPFYTGHLFSRANCFVASIYSIFVTFVLCFLPRDKSVDASTMNYAVVIAGFVWGGSLIYYAISARKWFVGPKLAGDYGPNIITTLNGEAFGSDSDPMPRKTDPAHSFYSKA